MHFAYTLLLGLAFALSLPYYLARGRGSRPYLRSLGERLGRGAGPLLPPGERSIWVHAVSVGEVLAARPLLAALRQAFPGLRLLVSTTTLTGQAVARASLRGIDGLFFSPFDFPGPVRHALERANPALLLLVETELWPNLIREARRRGTRIALVNGRISPRSFPRYRRVRALLARVLSGVDLFLMQAEPHAERARAIGAPPERVRVTGNVKFDALEPGPPPEPLARLVASRPGPLLVAGSTMAGEEALLLEAYRRVRERFPQAGLILAPRHPERFGEVPALVEAAGLRCLRRTALAEETAWDGEVVLLDTLGELARVYALASVVFVGGSLVAAGGHNTLEAAVAGKAVVVGPHMENFQEIADQFRAEDALVQVGSAEHLADALLALLADEPRRRGVGERARALADRNRGAVATTVRALGELLA